MQRTSTTGDLPDDPAGIAAARFVGELLTAATISLHYRPIDEPAPAPPATMSDAAAAESRQILNGWITTLTVDFEDPIPPSVAKAQSALGETLDSLPAAALTAVAQMRGAVVAGRLTPPLERALRDTIVVEFLASHRIWRSSNGDPRPLLARTLEYIIELSGTRVESQDLTHGVVITDALEDEPRLEVVYPEGLRDAKRSPLLFDGVRSVLIVDHNGRARTELQRHRLTRLLPKIKSLRPEDKSFVDRGSLVSLATDQLGGIGFFLRQDRSVWVFVDGRPIVIRRGEHWKAFPVWLARALEDAIGGGSAVDLIVRAALLVSAHDKGAIFGIVGSKDDLDLAVARKDRFDLRNESDPTAMRAETRLHHLIDTEELDDQTLARLASLDGATIVDCSGRLLAYGAILTSRDSEHEGARTAAAKSLSKIALAVLKVSQDGSITVFRDGIVMAELL